MKLFKFLVLLVLFNFSLMRIKNSSKFRYESKNTLTAKGPAGSIAAFFEYNNVGQSLDHASKWDWLFTSSAPSLLLSKGLVFAEKIYDKLVASDKYYYLPYRNLAKIYCDDTGRNGLYTDDGVLRYKISVYLWGDECRALANELDALRTNRIEKIKKSLIDYSKQATSYQENYGLQLKEQSNSVKHDEEIKRLQEKVKEQEKKIQDLVNKIPGLESAVKNAEMQTQIIGKNILGIQAKIDSANQQKETNQNSITTIESSKNDATKNKATFEALYAINLQNFNKFLKVISDESPFEQQTIKSIEGCPSKLSITDCPIGKILPL